MSFSRHGEIFPSDGAPTLGSNAPAHRLDESPVGYSLTGWSPPLPGYASPTSTSILQKGRAGGGDGRERDGRRPVRRREPPDALRAGGAAAAARAEDRTPDRGF